MINGSLTVRVNVVTMCFCICTSDPAAVARTFTYISLLDHTIPRFFSPRINVNTLQQLLSFKMPKSLTGSLKLLADIGIVKVALPPHQGPVTASSVATSSAGPVELAGSLGPGVPERAPDAPKQQPSLFWKSIGFCVKNKFTSSGSLRDDGRALFLADPGQPGIVAGDGWPREVTNFQLFLAADAMQQLNSPVFSLKGGSYFEFLNL